MEKNKVIVIGPDPKDIESIFTLWESKEADVVVVSNIEEAQKLLGDTTYPEIKPPKPFVIHAPVICERTFEDYKTGQQRRRERRAKERRHLK